MSPRIALSVRNKDQKNSDEGDEKEKKEVPQMANDTLKDKFKIDEQTSKKAVVKIIKESPDSG